MLICRVFIRQAIGSFVSPGRKGCFSTITLDIINDKPDWSWLSFVLLRIFLDGRSREANILLPYFSISPNILISQRPIFEDGDIFDAEDWISEIKLHGRDGDEIYFPQKKVPIVQLSNGWKWQSQGLKGRTARKGWKSSCRSCQRRAANLTQKLKHIWEPIMKEAQQKAFILCLRVKRARKKELWPFPSKNWRP